MLLHDDTGCLVGEMADTVQYGLPAALVFVWIVCLCLLTEEQFTELLKAISYLCI